MANRSSAAARNIGAALSLQIVTVALGFVVRAAFARSLGAETVGLNAVLADTLTLLSMAELGMSTAMAFSYLQPISTGDVTRLAILDRFYRRLYRYISVTIIILGLAALPALRYVVRLDPVPPNLEVYYLLLLLNTGLSYSCTHIVSLITAHQRAYLVLRSRVVIYLIQVLLQLIALLTFQSYLVYLILQVLGTTGVNLLIFRQGRRFRPAVRLRSYELPREDKSYIRNLLSSMAVYKGAILVFTASTTLIISVMFGTASVGVYAGYAMLIASISGFVNSGFASVTAGLGDAMLTETPARRSELFAAAHILALVLAVPIVLVFHFAATDFVDLWLGPEFRLDDLSVSFLSVGLYLTIILQPVWIFREATGMYRRTKWLMVGAALLNIVLAVLLAEAVGLVGVFVAPIAARLLSYFVIEPILLFRDFLHQRLRYYFLPIGLNASLVVGLDMIADRAGFRPSSNWLSLILSTTALFAATSAISLLLYHRSKGFCELRRVVGRMRS